MRKSTLLAGLIFCYFTCILTLQASSENTVIQQLELQVILQDDGSFDINTKRNAGGMLQLTDSVFEVEDSESPIHVALNGVVAGDYGIIIDGNNLKIKDYSGVEVDLGELEVTPHKFGGGALAVTVNPIKVTLIEHKINKTPRRTLDAGFGTTFAPIYWSFQKRVSSITGKLQFETTDGDMFCYSYTSMNPYGRDDVDVESEYVSKLKHGACIQNTITQQLELQVTLQEDGSFGINPKRNTGGMLKLTKSIFEMEGRESPIQVALDGVIAGGYDMTLDGKNLHIKGYTGVVIDLGEVEVIPHKAGNGALAVTVNPLKVTLVKHKITKTSSRTLEAGFGTNSADIYWSFQKRVASLQGRLEFETVDGDKFCYSYKSMNPYHSDDVELKSRYVSGLTHGACNEGLILYNVK
jgi:hypothetical protein